MNQSIEVRGGSMTTFKKWNIASTVLAILLLFVAATIFYSIAEGKEATDTAFRISLLAWVAHLFFVVILVLCIQGQIREKWAMETKLAVIKSFMLIMTVVGILPLCLYGLSRLYKAKRGTWGLAI